MVLNRLQWDSSHPAEILNYDYQESGLNDFVAVILDDMNNESEDGTYEFRGIRIHLSR